MSGVIGVVAFLQFEDEDNVLGRLYVPIYISINRFLLTFNFIVISYC